MTRGSRDKTPQEAIEGLIRQQGKITFAEFMELALFHHQGGYYTSELRVGAYGDFYTSPSAHPVFGALLAIQMEQMWELLGRPAPFFLVEVGAGSGLLARDLLGYAENLSRPFQESLRYLALDRLTPSFSQTYFPTPEHIYASNIPLHGVQGCFLSNELIDCFPVHRFQISGGSVQEIYVTLEEGQFAEVLGEPSTPLIQERLESLGIQLSEGYKGEVNLGIDPWVEEVSQTLELGFVITIDYGHLAQELYSPSRDRGTFRSYYKHIEGSNPYVRLGEQDMTAHVDFTSLMMAGERNGLVTLGIATQREFLTNLGFGAFLKSLSMKSSSLSQHDYYTHRMGMLDLIKPEGLGNFKVLVQGKGVGQPRLHALTPGNDVAKELEDKGETLALPALKPEHTNLMEGRYPHMHWTWDGVWPEGPVT